MNKLRVTSLFLGVATLILSTGGGGASADTSQAHSAVRRLNRSVLTVGREVFTALDATALLIAWNALASETVDIQSRWLEGFDLPQGSALDFEKSLQQWPQDVQMIFKIALIWVDVQKLNLFIPKEFELNEGLKMFEDSLAKDQKNVPTSLLKQIKSADSFQKKRWIGIVLRAQSFLRIRGAVERNKSIAEVGWYWHSGAEKVRSQ